MQTQRVDTAASRNNDNADARQQAQIIPGRYY